MVIIASLLFFYGLAVLFFMGYLTERELIIITFLVAVTEANLEVFAVAYAWYQGRKVDPYTRRLAVFISWSSLFMRLMKPVFKPLTDWIDKYIKGIPETVEEKTIRELQEENDRLKGQIEVLLKKRKWKLKKKG